MGWYKTTKLVGTYGIFYPFTLNGTFSHPDELAKSGHAANLAGLVGTMPRCNKALATHIVVFFFKHQQNGLLGLPKTDGLCELVGGFFFVKNVLWFNYLERAS